MTHHIAVGEDGLARCPWGSGDPLYQAYHDTEWGRPVVDDAGLFERISLEGFQSGLSWLTILRKREAFRDAFSGFAPAVVAGYGPEEVARLLDDARIVRHRGKIEATIRNARGAVEMIESNGSLARFLRSHAPTRGPAPESLDEVPAATPESRALASELKRRGWAFIGPTTAYSAMEAVGLVNDHLSDCHVREACEAEAIAAWAAV